MKICKQVLMVVGMTIFSSMVIAQSDSQISCIYQAYKNYIHSIGINKKNNLIYFKMRDGQWIVWDDHIARSFNEKINSNDLKDIFYIRYPAFRNIQVHPYYNEDPGRFRNQLFLKAVYGSGKWAVKNNLVNVRWLPKTLAHPVYLRFNERNGAAAALQKVSAELDNLPPEFKKYITRVAGTFNWRPIAGTQIYSAHSYGIAIDINTNYSNYWRWDNRKNLDAQHFIYHNKIPQQIVNIFEKNGFIWGGRWYHYDTMHFEYRPEFFVK